MKILYIGSGYVGVCSAAVSADSGHDTLAYDIDEKKIKSLSSNDRDTIESCLFEDGLVDLLLRNKDRIIFTSDYDKVKKFIEEVDAIVMCLPTPEIGETGESDLSYYVSAAKRLADSLAKRNSGQQKKYVIIVNKSTVPINMVSKTEEIMNDYGVKNFGVVSNPEFLVEGKAISGSLKPDRVVVGASTEKDFMIMRQIYRRFYDSATVKYIEVNPGEAAASKLLANFYLFNKLAVCFDVIGRTCETFPDIHFENVRSVLTSDKRIGNWGFYDSLYAGGSCFIKDARSLSFQLLSAGQNADIVNGTYLANKRQLEIFLSRSEREADFSWDNKIVTLLGTAFKQDTNDVRNSPSVDIVNYLVGKNVKQIKIFDPAALGWFKTIFPPSERFVYASDKFEALGGAQALIISTDWPEFRGVADVILTKPGQVELIMDGRRLLQHKYNELKAAGFDIIAVGCPFINGGK